MPQPAAQPVITQIGEFGSELGRRTWATGLREFWRSRELMVVLAVRDLQIRYKQALIGVAWLLLQPLFSMLLFTFLFSRVARFPSSGVPYPVFVLTGIILWQFFSRVFNDGTGSLVVNRAIVTKVYFPRL